MSSPLADAPALEAVRAHRERWAWLDGVRELRLGPPVPEARRINLRDLGFVGTVSDEARAQIAAHERRAARVLTTAHRYLFR
jgi:hypothetical protein